MDFKAIGRYLKSEREKKGLGFDQIFEKTRIQPHILEEIENGTSQLPDSLLKGFIKNYGQALYLDVSNLFQDQEPAKEHSKKNEPVFKKKKLFSFSMSFFQKRTFLYGGLILIVALFFSLKKESSKPSSIRADAPQKFTPLVFSHSISQSLFQEEVIVQPSDFLELYFKTDNQSLQTKQLQPSQWYVIKATEKIYVRFNNKSPVNIFYNGQKMSHKTMFFEKIFSRDTL